MRYLHFSDRGSRGIAAAEKSGAFHAIMESDARYPGDIDHLISLGPEALKEAGDSILKGSEIALDSVILLPPLPAPGKIICVGLNYVDHSAETGFEVPDYPLIFARFASTFVGAGAPIVRPRISEQLDFEGEFVAVIGKEGRHIAKSAALDHVIAYSLFNDASIRDFQRRTPQWTVGKNFDATGPFGPYIVTADELPPGCKGLRIQTRLNGKVMQDANTDDLVFDVETLISTLSEAFALLPGDIIVTGTAAGVGGMRKPPIWMKPGDVVEVELEQFGILRNPVVDEIN